MSKRVQNVIYYPSFLFLLTDQWVPRPTMSLNNEETCYHGDAHQLLLFMLKIIGC